MITAILVACALGATPDVLHEFEAWLVEQPGGMGDPTQRRAWIDRFATADTRGMPGRSLERLGDLYMADGAPLDAMLAYRAACTATGAPSASSASKFGMAALAAGSPRDAAEALQYFDAAGGNVGTPGTADTTDWALGEFRAIAPTLVLDAAIQRLRNSLPRSPGDADGASDAWNDAMASGRMEFDAASARLAGLMNLLDAWDMPPGAVVDFDPMGLAKAGLAVTDLDPGNSTGVGAVGGALRAATLRGNESRIIEIAELAAADVTPLGSNNAELNELNRAASRLATKDSPIAQRISRRLYELSIAAEEHRHPDAFRTMSNWQMSLLGVARQCMAEGDVAGAKDALARLKTARLEGYVLSSLAEAEDELRSLEADDAPEPPPEPAHAAAPAPREDAAVHSHSEVPTEPNPRAPQPRESPASTHARAPAAVGSSRGLTWPIVSAVAVLCIALAWLRRARSGPMGA